MKSKKLSLYKMIPNMITLTAIAAGMTSVKFAIVGKWEEAVIAIVVAAFMDAFDGAAARLLKAQSKLGAELDSLSDFICFGVAPAIVVFLWSTHDAGRSGWITSLIFAMAVALRLARFNISKDEEKPDDPLAKYFTGVPSPAGAGLAVLPMIVSFQLDPVAEADFLHYVSQPQIVGIWLLVLGAMMVSHIPTFSSKQIRVPQKMSVPALALFGIMIAGLINETWPTLTLMGVAYLLAMPWSVVHYNKKKASLAQGLKDPDDLDPDD
ncbi:MAG: phosphatidylcholine/phosphatidylserine synthase [Alphaproteobacteria bacterium]|nr:phosphatidylcholine/phosphatidylserine synthase [Alphaproteobacteria bacterium]